MANLGKKTDLKTEGGDWVPEEKKGVVKITIEMEINGPLMDAIKESREQIVSMASDVVKQRVARLPA